MKWPKFISFTVKLGNPSPCKLELSTWCQKFQFEVSVLVGISNEITKFSMNLQNSALKISALLMMSGIHKVATDLENLEKSENLNETSESH